MKRNVIYLTKSDQQLQKIREECLHRWNIIGLTDNRAISMILGTMDIVALLYDIETGTEDFLENLNTLNEQYPTLAIFIVSKASCLALSNLIKHFESVRACFKIPFNSKTIKQTIESELVTPSYKKQITAIRNLQKNADYKNLYRSLIGISQASQKLRRFIIATKDSAFPILLYGETGAGKDLVAQLIHQYSSQKGDYIAQNMSCIPENLAESILFGTEKGAYTGALSRAGLFEQANGGTLFLDEIQNLSLKTQAKLLRVIEHKEYRRLGSTTLQHSNFRLISASNKKLSEATTNGTFREDLYYRLNVLHTEIYPLREHPEDIPLLATHHLNKYCKNLSSAAIQRLYRHKWHGNIRELFSCLDRAVFLARSRKTIYRYDIVF